MSERFVTDTLNKADTEFDISLRPGRFSDFVGQGKVRERLELFCQAAKGRGDTLDHLLLFGPPGLGKTTLAYIVGDAMGVNVRSTSGPVSRRISRSCAGLTSWYSSTIRCRSWECTAAATSGRSSSCTERALCWP